MKNNLIFLVFFSLLISCAPTKKIADQSPINASTSIIRDGSTFEKAIIIDKPTEKAGVDAEYEWLSQNYPEYKFKGQGLSNYKKVPFDILNITTADGQSKSIYFNISRFFGKF